MFSARPCWRQVHSKKENEFFITVSTSYPFYSFFLHGHVVAVCKVAKKKDSFLKLSQNDLELIEIIFWKVRMKIMFFFHIADDTHIADKRENMRVPDLVYELMLLVSAE